MNERVKRLLMLFGFIVAVLMIGYAIYAVFFRAPRIVVDNTPTVEDEPGGATTDGLPSSEGGITTPSGGSGTQPPASEVADGGATETQRLTASEVLAPTLAKDGRAVSFYDPRDGKFYTVQEDGEIRLLSDAAFPDAQTIVWSDEADQVVIEFPDGSNVIYNFTAEEQTTLPIHWEEFDFSPSGEEVIAKSLGDDASVRAIVITSTDVSNTDVVAALGDNASLVDISWSPNDQVIAFSNTASAEGGGFGRNLILPIGKNEENYKGLVVDGLNFHAIWSPDGARVLYDVSSSSSDYRPLLWVVDATPATMGNNRQSLGLNTWVEKCTFFNAKTVYCAVPEFLPANVGLQPELLASTDAVYRIDLTTGKVRLVGFPDRRTRMEHLTISENGSLLYYTDAEERLRVMRLK